MPRDGPAPSPLPTGRGSRCSKEVYPQTDGLAIIWCKCIRCYGTDGHVLCCLSHLCALVWELRYVLLLLVTWGHIGSLTLELGEDIMQHITIEDYNNTP